MKIKRLLIANRGEILRRVAMTARQWGIKTVTVWQDEDPPPVTIAQVVDEFVTVTGASNVYLDQQALLDVARTHACDAVHPGFGFLSENAEFAQACISAGLIWVGPHPKAMIDMASKDTSRQIAKRSGVPVNDALPGFEPKGKNPDLSKAIAFAKETGLPLLVKAAMGGGGKGMRLVETIEQLPEAITRGYSEAMSAFGDGTLLIEKYITSPRHVEVQIMGDKHGNVYAIGDRDCSIQRRHQKIIEEAPAPNLDESTRRSMHEAAVALAQSVGYDSAGTVEFLVDAGSKDKVPFFFLEMNTRLQVEHPVTEEVYGLDLVAWQLRVACGDHLPDWSQIQPRGHAIEARIYAEDCGANFMPCPGPIFDFRPSFGPGIRWETGIDRCDRVYETYDPMIAKAIAYGQSRSDAMSRLSESLKRTALFGTVANIAYLVTLLEHPKFCEHAVTTHFLKEEALTINQLNQSRTDIQRDLVAEVRRRTQPLLTSSQSGEIAAESAIALRRCAVFQNDTSWQPQTDTAVEGLETYRGNGGIIQSGSMRLEDKVIYFCIYKGLAKCERWFSVDGVFYHDTLAKASLSQYMSSQSTEGDVTAPVPGKVISVNATSGQNLRSGDVVLILESMKLEFEVRADREGEVAQVHVAPGDQVTAGDKLVSWHVN